MANISAIAVSAFSPPERSWTFCSRLPGRLRDDVDPALELVVLVEQHEAGAPAAEERRERPLEVRVDGDERLAEALLRRLLDLLDRVAGRGDRIHEVLALARQERVARLEIVELVDRHHVDGPIFSILARRSPPSRRASCGRPARHGFGHGGAGPRPLPRRPRLATPPRRIVLDLRRLRRIVHGLRAGEQPVALELGHFGGDLVQRRLDGLGA
jgi:hypothetical protein